jgi:hypothetical protein
MSLKNPLLNHIGESFHYPFLLVSIIFSTCCFAVNTGIKIAPAPSWLTDVSLTDTMTFDKPSISTGYYYLMFNSQENVPEKQFFRHSSIKLLTSEGVQEMSDLSISFDPAYQKLIFHSIKVVRDGVCIDKLRTGHIRVVQREVNMDRYIYDGRLTAVVNLPDIRVGDIIDYSYSLCGENPLFGGMYNNVIYLQYSVPIDLFFYRLIVPNSRRFQFKYRNGASEPQQSAGNDRTTYSWEKRKLKEIVFDINTPDWYDPYPAVSVSEYGSWDQVVRQIAPMYSESPQTRDILKKRLRNTVTAAGKDSAIIQSIRFVQDHIRYLGFENGMNSHKPTPPLTLLSRRFGDCKAKSFLLCEILKSCSVEAYPVLVHTCDNHSIRDDLPSPNLFNHCVVQFIHNNWIYYVDPTISFQGGDVDHLYFPDYRCGLVLKDGTASLDSILFRNYYNVKVCETFTLDTVGGAAELTVSTRYTGGAADRTRNEFNSTSGEALEKEYVNFYSRMYPTIRAAGKIKVTDRRDRYNEFIVEEYYRIDSLWRKTDTAKNQLSAEFYPLSLETYVSNKKSPNRTMPYDVEYPVDYQHLTVVNLPEAWTIRDDSTSITAPSFSYSYSVHYKNNRVTLLHHYKTLKDHIEASVVEGYISKHDDIMKNLSYILTYTPSAAQGSSFRFSWAAFLVSFIILAISSYGAAKVYRDFDMNVQNPGTGPQMLGGWLILIGIGLVLSPFRIAYDLYKTPDFFNGIVWGNLFDLNNSSKNLVTGIVMSFELVFNVVKFVYVGLLILLFFKRRSTFPVLAIFFYLISILVLVIDTWSVSLLHGTALTAADQKESVKSIIQGALVVLIWVPYLLRSNRVRETFVVRAPRKGRSNSNAASA